MLSCYLFIYLHVFTSWGCDSSARHQHQLEFRFIPALSSFAHRGAVGGGVTTSHRLLFFLFSRASLEEREIEMQSPCTLVTPAHHHHSRLHSRTNCSTKSHARSAKRQSQEKKRLTLSLKSLKAFKL